MQSQKTSYHYFGPEGVAHIMHTTQQTFVIGPFAKLDTFHWLRCIL